MEPEARVNALREAVDAIVVRALGMQQAHADGHFEEPDSERVTKTLASTICESLGITWEMAETIDQANPWVSVDEPNHDEVWDTQNELLLSGYDALAALLTLAEIKR